MFKFPKTELQGVSFYVLGNQDNDQDAMVTVRHSETYHQGEPSVEGPLSLKMGTTDNRNRCMSCAHKKNLCPGHHGQTILKYPIPSPSFLKNELISWLKAICFTCSNVLISDEKIASVKKIHPRKRWVQEIAKKAYGSNKNPICVRCGSSNPKVTKDIKDNVTIWAEYYNDVKGTELLDQNILYYHIIENILNKISPETVEKLGRPLVSHPNKFIIRNLRAPPNTIRPDVRKLDSGRSNKNDITKLFQTIVSINERLPDKIPENITIEFYEDVKVLSSAVFEMIKGSNQIDKGIQTNSKQVLTSIAKRLPGKPGRIRKNLMGRRVNHMARSIITCDPSLKPTQIRLPIRIAKNITQKITVREYNYEEALMYFMNGVDRYPGCKGIIKKSTGRYHGILTIGDNFQLELGDVLERHTVQGDIVNFNRQPSLEISSISSMEVIIGAGDTIGLNVMACPLFGADFDGDEMNVLFAQSTRVINEIDMLASPRERFTSYKNGAPVMGQSQDNLAGCVQLTRFSAELDKLHAMQLFAQTDISHDFSSKSNSREGDSNDIWRGTDIITILLQESGDFINYDEKANIYKKSQEAYREYIPEEINVKIRRGEHITGVLDKKAIGEGAFGGIFHIIFNKYGTDRALKAAYNMQQIALQYLYNIGITMTVSDALLNHQVMGKIQEVNSNLIEESRSITRKLNKGELVAPLGKTIVEYYESLQINALNPGDDFWPHILNSVDENYNYLFVYPDSGVKGKAFNFINSSCSLGQQLIQGERISEKLAGRSFPYYTRYDSDPRSRGFVTESFLSGLGVAGHLASAMVGRMALISRSLSTAKTGYQNRQSIKNLEGHITDCFRALKKSNLIIQLLYGGDGVDSRYLEKVKIPTIMLSDAELLEYKLPAKRFAKSFHNKQVTEMLNNEYEQLVIDRDRFRDKFIKRESNTGRMFNNKIKISVNINRIIKDVVHNYTGSATGLDPVHSLQIIKEFIDDLVYIHTNEIYQAKRGKIPEYLHKSLEFLRIIMRAHLSLHQLLKNKVNDKTLMQILKQCGMRYLKSLINYGKPIGIIAAQCISEPMTQIVLDSHHQSSSASVKKKGMWRIEETLKVRPIEKMKSPSMSLCVMQQYEENLLKVQEIANEIEMLTLRQFINKPLLFAEEYGTPVYPDYKHESQLIKDFEKYNPLIKVPSDLMNICIRYTLFKEKLIEKNINIETIYNTLRQQYPDIFILYNVENSQVIIMRIYLRNRMFKKVTLEILDNVMEEIQDTIVRGVTGIIATYVKNKTVSYVAADGSIEKKRIYYILTDGSNINELVLNPNIDPNRIDSDCIMDIYDNFGIEAARLKIINELYEQLDESSEYRHFTNYADEMCWTGIPTAIDRFGSAKRDTSVLMQVSDASPLKVLENACVYNKRDLLKGVSPCIMMGQNPKIGDLYSSFKTDETFIAEKSSAMMEMLEDI